MTFYKYTSILLSKHNIIPIISNKIVIQTKLSILKYFILTTIGRLVLSKNRHKLNNNPMKGKGRVDS